MSNGSPTPAPPVFWHEVMEHFYGKVHRADPKGPEYVPSLLFVFVHGVRATHESTWERDNDDRSRTDLPRDLLRALGVDVDVLSFRYPSLSFQRAGVDRAANRLAACLSLPRFGHHRHVVYFAHSNGGIVVKRYLNERYPEGVAQLDRVLAPPGDGFNAQVAMHTAWSRTRGVINFDVPHFGGAYYLTAFATVATALLGPVLTAAQLCRNGLPPRLQKRIVAPEWGWNRIFAALYPRNRALDQLHRTHLDQLGDAHRRRYPQPAVRDLLAENNGVIRLPNLPTIHIDGSGTEARVDADGRKYHVLRGNHADVKMPAGYDGGALMQVLAGAGDGSGARAGGWLDGLRDWWSIGAAELMLRRLLCDQLTRVDSPIGAAAAGAGAPGDSQAGMLADAYSRIEHGHRRIRIVGPPGVGKSTVLRLLARRYGVEYLGDWFDRARRCPLFVQLRDPAFNEHLPLPRLPQGPSVPTPARERVARRRGRQLLLRVARAWCQYVNSELGLTEHPRRYTLRWIDRRLTDPSRRTLLVVDSIDEFLANHANVTLADAAAAFRLFRERYNTPNVATVTATRISLQPGDPSAPSLDRLQAVGVLGDSGDTRVLGEMSEDDCRAAFPVVGAILPLVPRSVHRMLLTPLFARIFNRSTEAQLRDRLNSPTGTFRTALEELYRHSDLLADEPTEGRATADEWTAALAVVVWWMFDHFRSSLPKPPGADLTGPFWEEVVSGELAPALPEALALLRDPVRRDRLLNRTVLRRVVAQKGVEEFALYHKEFADFLIAWYSAACIERDRFGDLARRAMNTQVFTGAGELLVSRGFVVTAAVVARLVAECRARNHWFVFGNVGALIGNSFLPLDGAAVYALVDALRPPAPVGGAPVSEIDPTVRVIMLANWSRRALRCAPGAAPADPHARVLLNALTNPGPAGLIGYATAAAEPLARSAAWCYLREFADRCGTSEPPEFPVAQRLAAAGAVVAACAELLDHTRGDVRLTPIQFRSLEVGWCRVVESVHRADGKVIDGDRAIMAVHYLFALTALVRLVRHQDPETPGTVEHALAPGAPLDELAAARRATRADDELARIYEECRKVFRGDIN